MHVVAKDVCLAVGRGGRAPSRVGGRQMVGHGGGRQNWAVAEECDHPDALGGHHDSHDGQLLLLFLDLRGYYKRIIIIE